jgi:hypothetical protein
MNAAPHCAETDLQENNKEYEEEGEHFRGEGKSQRLGEREF